MNIGKLRHRVKLLRLSEVQDDFGELIKSYVVYDQVWGRVEPLQGKELEHAKQISGHVSVKVTIRYNASVVGKDRVKRGERELEIEGILNPDERNEMLILMCKEVV